MNVWAKLMRIARSGMEGLGLTCNPAGSVPGQASWSLSAYLNPLCWGNFNSNEPSTGGALNAPISSTDPNSPLNPNVCYGGGALLNQQACLQAQAGAAAAVAASDPSGAAAAACANSDYEAFCLLGLTDSNGNVYDWVWFAIIGVVAAVALMERR